MLLSAALVAACCTASPTTAESFARRLADAGPRPAASAAERRAHAEVAARFRRAGLRVGVDAFTVPGKGRSRNVVGVADAPDASCLRVVMAHVDTTPTSPGADDNASGVGALVALAAALRRDRPPCDTWLVATGAEERPYTGHPDHLGALAVVRRLRRLGRADDLQYGLSLDEVGRGTSFSLRSPARGPRPGVEGALLRVAAGAGVRVRWVRDGGSGNSDHRELALAGLPAMKLGVPDDPARHSPRDRSARLQRGAFTRVLRVVGRLLGRPAP